MQIYGFPSLWLPRYTHMHIHAHTRSYSGSTIVIRCFSCAWIQGCSRCFQRGHFLSSSAQCVVVVRVLISCYFQSKMISFILYNLTTTSLFGVALVYLTSSSDNLNTTVVIESALILWGVISTVGALVASKFYFIIRPGSQSPGQGVTRYDAQNNSSLLGSPSARDPSMMLAEKSRKRAFTQGASPPQSNVHGARTLASGAHSHRHAASMGSPATNLPTGVSNGHTLATPTADEAFSASARRNNLNSARSFKSPQPSPVLQSHPWSTVDKSARSALVQQQQAHTPPMHMQTIPDSNTSGLQSISGLSDPGNPPSDSALSRGPQSESPLLLPGVPRSLPE